MEGTIKFFNETKGFGFITQSNGEQDIFVHISGVAAGSAQPKEGDKVTYEVVQGKKGLQAENVVVLG